MHDATETTFDRWWASAEGGGLRVGLSAWPGGTAVSALKDGSASPTASVSLRKSHVFADRYVPGVLEETRLIVALRLNHGESDRGVAVWREPGGDRAMSVDELAMLGVLAVRQAWHDPTSPQSLTTGFRVLTDWLFTALDADDGALLSAMRRIEPRVFEWWGGVLKHSKDPAAAERAWIWQAEGRAGQAPPDAAIRSLLELMKLKVSTPADRLGLCRRAQQIFDESGFRDFDLQTALDVARSAALVDLGYHAQGVEGLVEVEKRLVANPCGSALRQTAKLAWLGWRAGGLLRAASLTAALVGGVVGSATARFKLRKAWSIRRLRSRRPRLPQDATLPGLAPDVNKAIGVPPIRRVALVRLDKIGDLINMQPIVARVRERFPDAEIDLYVTKGLDVFAPMLATDVRGVEVDWKNDQTFDGLLKQVAAEDRYDVLIDLLEPEVTRHARLTKAIDATYKVGFDSPARREAFTHRVPTPTGPTHLIDRTSRLLRPLGLAVPDAPGWGPRLSLDEAAIASGEAVLREAVGAGRVLGVHVGAGWRFKQWYPESLAEVARSMVDRHGVRVAVLAGPSEVAIAQRVADLIGDAAAVVQPTLSDLPGVCRACDLMLVNDSGPMHAAVAVGVPTVVAWGPGDRTLFAPRGESVRVVADQPRCANCPQEVDAERCPMGYRYEAVPCLGGVTVDAVRSTCEAVLIGEPVASVTVRGAAAG